MYLKMLEKIIFSKQTLKYVFQQGKEHEKLLSKAFLNKIRNLSYSYSSNRYNPRIFCYENTKKPKENFYRLLLPREIQNSKVLILNSIKEYNQLDSYVNRNFLKPILYGFSSCLLISLYNLNSFCVMMSFLWMFPILRINKMLPINNIIITSIYMKSCGRFLEINTLINSFIIDIIKIRKLRNTELYFFKQLFNDYHKEFTPIIIDNTVYLIPKCLEFVDKEILFAISNSCYVENN